MIAHRLGEDQCIIGSKTFTLGDRVKVRRKSKNNYYTFARAIIKWRWGNITSISYFGIHVKVDDIKTPLWYSYDIFACESYEIDSVNRMRFKKKK